MNAQKTTPLGLLLDALQLPSGYVASSIFVDQSLISKWKNGSRKLKRSSPYFQKLVDLFVAENKRIGQQTLEQFFTNLYGYSVKTPDIRAHVVQLLSTDGMLFSVRKQANALYSAGFATYAGRTGMKDAFLLLLRRLSEQQERQTLYIHECSSFAWLLQDGAFLNKWTHLLTSLMDEGHKTIVLYESLKDTETFIEQAHQVLAHKNCTEHFLPAGGNFFCSQYLATKTMSLLAFGMDQKTCYGSAFFDQNTLIAHQSALQALHKDTNDQTLIKRMLLSAPLAERLVCYSKTPSFFGMEQQLLNEVLAQNQLDSKTKETCLALHNAAFCAPLCEMVELEAAQKLLTLEKTQCNSFRLITDVPVVLTKEQWKRHLLHLKKQVQAKKRISFVLTLPFSLSPLLDAGYYAQKNLWAVYGGEDKWYHNAQAVGGIYALLENIRQNTPSDYQDQAAFEHLKPFLKA